MGVIGMLFILMPFLKIVDNVTQSHGISAFDSAEAIPVALSAFHTSFNVLNSFVLIWFIPFIVKIVMRVVPEREDKALNVDQPKYLSENVLNYPQTAIRALVNESQRLFEGPAFKVVAHALNLHREDIMSDMKPKKVVAASKDIIDIDIDDLYYTRVKSIYSQILRFGTLIQSRFTLSPDKVEAVNKIKVANRYIVESIKDARALQDNVDKYMVSGNKYIQKEYDRLRRKTARVLRAIHNAKTDARPEAHLRTLEKLKEDVKLKDALIDGTLDELIRKEMITSEMAASLANDSNYVTDICRHMIAAAELLYIQSDMLLDEVPELALESE
jgi:phosphate:Na+ symporter